MPSLFRHISIAVLNENPKPQSRWNIVIFMLLELITMLNKSFLGEMLPMSLIRSSLFLDGTDIGF